MYFSPLCTMLMKRKVWSCRHPMPKSPVSSQPPQWDFPRTSFAAVCCSLHGCCWYNNQCFDRFIKSHGFVTYNLFVISRSLCIVTSFWNAGLHEKLGGLGMISRYRDTCSRMPTMLKVPIHTYYVIWLIRFCRAFWGSKTPRTIRR